MKHYPSVTKHLPINVLTACVISRNRVKPFSLSHMLLDKLSSFVIKQCGKMTDVLKRYAEFVNQYKNLTRDEQVEYKDKMVGEQVEASQHLKLPKEKINMNSVAIGTLLFLFMVFGVVLQIFSL